jgi:DNA-directed RNA polymerase specialized sigma24 family protein
VLQSLDFGEAEQRYHREPADTLTAEVLFERRWALTLLDGVLASLQSEYRESDKERLFDLLKASLLGDHDALSYAAAASSLDMTEAAVKKAAQRLRQRYREVLREQVTATVDGPEAFDDEIRELFRSVGT